MAYKVKLNVFEGPFDLLLHLVRINEMDIYDIPISDITKQYLGFIKDMETLDLEVAGDFLVMAATLLNLKSRTLMPLNAHEEDEQEEEVDEEFENIRSAQDLMQRLVEYRQFKELAVKLSEREEQKMRMFYRNQVLPTLSADGSREEVREDINLLFSAFARILEFTEHRPQHRVTEEAYSVEEKIELVGRKLVKEKRLSLMALFEKCLSKVEMITMFLALLELCKVRQARIVQKSNFEDIQLVLATEPEEDDDEE